MNTDIRISIDFFDRPQTLLLKSLVGDAGITSLQKLWILAARSNDADIVEAGRLTGYRAGDLESILSWFGESGELINALLESGYLADDGGCLVLPNWRTDQEYASRALERRETARQGGMASGKSRASKKPAKGKNEQGVRTGSSNREFELKPQSSSNSKPNQTKPSQAEPSQLPAAVPVSGSANK